MNYIVNRVCENSIVKSYSVDPIIKAGHFLADSALAGYFLFGEGMHKGYKLSEITKYKMRKAQRRPIKFRKNFNGCYICTSHTTNSRGYPVMKFHGKMIKISRYLYSIKYGDIPSGNIICHTCDNPSCVNIKHLFIGTHKINSMDMVNKGRSLKGSLSPNTHLTEDQVVAIKQYPKYHGVVRYLSRLYGVTETTISYMRSNKSWKHI